MKGGFVFGNRIAYMNEVRGGGGGLDRYSYLNGSGFFYHLLGINGR